MLHGTLGIKKNGIALKQAKQEPAGIEAYADMNNICYMMAEALEEQKTFYTTLKDHVCTLGCAATGLDPVLAQMSDEERTASDQYHTAAINIFPSEEIQNRVRAAGSRAVSAISGRISGGYHRAARAACLTLMRCSCSAPRSRSTC